MSTSAPSVQINAVFNIKDTTYTASMNIPDTSPTASSPFVFSVTTQPTSTATSTSMGSPILTVAVGAPGQVYVAVAPPSDLIVAAVGDMVTALNVVVSEGTFDTGKNTFSTPI